MPTARKPAAPKKTASPNGNGHVAERDLHVRRRDYRTTAERAQLVYGAIRALQTEEDELMQQRDVMGLTDESRIPGRTDENGQPQTITFGEVLQDLRGRIAAIENSHDEDFMVIVDGIHEAEKEKQGREKRLQKDQDARWDLLTAEQRAEENRQVAEQQVRMAEAQAKVAGAQRR